MPAFSALYIEDQCRDFPRVQNILKKCAALPHISCERYGEVFNPKAQNFRFQKKRPALILAKKHQHFVLPAPAGYGFGNKNSYYFSHLLNCPYDCRYCFLQGMYRSAHYVLFVNYEDFAKEISETIEKCGDVPSYFYAGYDSDSLALEQYSQFADYFLPFFKNFPQAILELRTKSVQIRSLLKYKATKNVIIALSFSPEQVSKQLEHRVPTFSKRIAAAKKLQEAGWSLALRFEPLIHHKNYQTDYQQLFQRIFSILDADKLHSVSTGLFRMPQTFFRNIVKIYPDEALFAGHYDTQQGLATYPKGIETEMLKNCETALFDYIPKEIYYRCGTDCETT